MPRQFANLKHIYLEKIDKNTMTELNSDLQFIVEISTHTFSKIILRQLICIT